MTLDPEQAAVVHASAQERLVVTAPPGAGKSHVLVSRAEALVDEEDTRVLAISFSQAAVHVMRQRAAAANLHNVDFTTVDSLAGQLLATHGGELGSSFDATILRAISAVATWSHQAARWNHILVDEAQDIRGVRAELLHLVMSHCQGGATILGDPRQAIFDFDDQGDDSPTVLDLVHDDERFKKVELTGNYRSSSRESKAVAAIRDSDARAAAALEQHVSTNLGRIDSLGSAARRLSSSSETVALLTRTRAQAAWLSAELGGSGVAIGVTDAAQTTGPADWIAKWLAAAPAKIQLKDFEALVAEHYPEDLRFKWRQLVALVPVDRGRLAVADVARALASARALPAGLRSLPGRQTISTVHRAKGLEFDEVILLNPLDWKTFDNDGESNARVLYVALTRARKHTFELSLKEDRRWKFDKLIGRPVKSAFRGGTLALGLEGTDALTRRPLPTAQRDAQQEWLNRLTSPVQVSSSLNRARTRPNCPIFDLTADDGTIVGQTGRQFGEVVAKLSRRPDHWPALRRLTVAGVITDGAAPGTAEDLPRNGLWLAPRLSGAVDLEWNGKH